MPDGMFQPRKVDDKALKGFGVDALLPKQLVVCPRCGMKPSITGKKTVEGFNVYECKFCHIKFSQFSKRRGKCNLYNKLVSVQECMNCQNLPKPVSKNNPCPHFGGKIDELFPEGWERK